MTIFKEAGAICKYLDQLKRKGLTIGFAPTMGALHKGHIALIDKSKSICNVTVSSIFVNPTQFNDPNDFAKYPVTIANDIMLLENAGCDVLFLPAVNEIYPNGTDLKNRYDLGQVEFILEGKYRPEHFQGVCQVLHKLLMLVQPHNLFMGQKDYQQCIVVKKLIDLLKLPTGLITVPTLREESGLALSSRNVRLTHQQKIAAASVFKMLVYIKNHYKTVPFRTLEKYAAGYLSDNHFSKIDYISIANASTLQPVETVKDGDKVVALIAAYMDDVRLIDNAVLTE